ncbi:cation efflux family-domain-containing protein [Crassisporium funariophilum]|nr:cation efflux family-domain-containing protein [Crassisporium funariophilum]
MPAPDARTRNKISLNPSKILSTSRLIPRILLSNVLFVFAVYASKEWLLNLDVGIFWVVMRVLACGGFGVLVWEGLTGQSAKRKQVEWSVLGTASLLQFVRYGCLFTALYRLSSPRVILFAHFSTYWIGSLMTPSSATVAAAITISILSDTQLSMANLWRFAPGYGALLLHALSSSALDHTLGVLSPSLGTTFSAAATTLGASIFALPFYIFRTFVLQFPPTPVLPLVSLASIPVIAYSLLFLTPLTTASITRVSFKPQHFGLSYPTLVVLSFVFGSVVFRQTPTWSDMIIASLLYVGMYPETLDSFTPIVPRTPTSRLVRSYLKTILANPESRKIFYFLMLNLCYMLVQMLYGVWTNSLGLISDAIHMAFDCMAIGVGLFASVMATWDPNERFTYGYGRIETLSGFANGIFLILISIFIIFEAIQRLMEPPEMNTSQLLLVSSLGLAVNLFGMFAMGGHHHHGGGGHSHSHGHSHSAPKEDTHSGHSHGPAPTPIQSAHSHDHGHSHSHAPDDAHDHEHEHDHSHRPPSPPSSHAHPHSHSQSESHSHSHSPPPIVSHSHSHSPPPHSSKAECDDHSHSPKETHSHSHESHSHSHSPPSESHSHSHSHAHNEPSITVSSPVRSSNHSRSMSTSSVADRAMNGHSHPAKRHSRGPSISIDLAQGDNLLRPPVLLSPTATPITPSYTFGHDDHYTEHHDSKPAPNLHDPSHSHSQHEGHSHNMRGVFLHVMADTLGSVGVIISTLLIQFYGWTGFDPIASLFIAILIAASVIPLVMDTGKVLALDVADRDVDIQRALAELSSIEGLASYSSPRFWPKDSSSLIGSIHIQLEPSASSHDPSGPHSSRGTTYTKVDRVVERVDSLLRQKISGLEELTIQVEGKPLHSMM